MQKLNSTLWAAPALQTANETPRIAFAPSLAASAKIIRMLISGNHLISNTVTEDTSHNKHHTHQMENSNVSCSFVIHHQQTAA